MNYEFQHEVCGSPANPHENPTMIEAMGEVKSSAEMAKQPRGERPQAKRDRSCQK